MSVLSSFGSSSKTAELDFPSFYWTPELHNPLIFPGLPSVPRNLFLKY
jgi:hypothetical protein